ncbi:MAG: ParA family protein, partial [Clostridia bacterium]|nr:ParA family protein [Clostridia bacterium]
MTKTICFANNKGGSGKSTSCANVGYALAQKGKKVLLIDGDMQLNLSLSLFDEDTVLAMARSENNLYAAIRDQRDLTDCIVETPYNNLFLIPSSTLMSGIEYELFTKWQREFILKKCLKSIKESNRFDYILLDAPPTLGGWVMNLLCASDFLLIPVEASPWGMFGLANMFDFYATVKEIAPDLTVLGVAVTKVNERKNYFRQTMEALRAMEGVPV